MSDGTRWITGALVGWTCAMWPGVLAAQTHLGNIVVSGQAPAQEAQPSSADEPAFVTVIDVPPANAGQSSVADVLEGQAGVRVRSRGGLGSFTALSIRGSESSEVAVYLDGVPLNRAIGAAVDLAQLPIDGIERIEVYRGVVPIELGGDAIGGAIHLISRRDRATTGQRWRAAGGGGSFGARSASLSYERHEGGVGIAINAAYNGARGDFRYYDNQGTLLDTSDDFYARRQNNGFDQGALDLTLRGGRTARWTLGSHGFLKRQGVPGIGTQGAETRTATLTTGRLVLDGRLHRSGFSAPSIDADLGAHLVLERLAFRNLDADRVGGFSPARSDGETVAVGLDGRIEAALGTHQLVRIIGEARLERYRAYDLLQPTPVRPASLRIRAAVALSDELRWLGDRLALSPAVRLDAVSSQLGAVQSVRAAPSQVSSTEIYVSPRLGVRYRIAEALSLKANVGRFVRLPTLLELFGDGAFVIGRPELRPEVALGGDGGLDLSLVRQRGRHTLTLQWESAFFGRMLTDAIALLPASRALAARNIGRATTLGLELRGTFALGRALAVAVNYTFLDARNYSDEPGAFGKQLPGRARHELLLRLNAARGPVAGFYEAHFLGTVYRDPQNFNPVPRRWLHALGISIGPFGRAALLLGVEVRNLLDLRVVDLPLGGTANAGRHSPYPVVDIFDYPLPGRSFYATLSLRR